MTNDFVRIEKKDRILLNGKDCSYTAVGEDYPVHSKDGTLVGSMFVYSYVLKDAGKDRPVLFAYNGGPGSSAIWLYTGVLSPKTIRMDEKYRTSVMPDSEVRDNPNCLLDVCDIVVIDMLHTGNSLIMNEEKMKEFYSTSADAVVFADVIRTWLVQNNRLNSPKYLMGESFGTVRTAFLVNELYGGPTYPGHRCTGIAVDGIILAGSLFIRKPGVYWAFENDIPKTALDLPTMAAARWYHRRPEGISLEAFIEGAYEFSTGEYLTLLARLHKMKKEDLQAAVQKLAWYTGIPEPELRRYDFQMPAEVFMRELLRDEDKDIGQYDARFTMHAAPRDIVLDPVGDDPAMGLYTGPYRTVMNSIQKYYLGEDFRRDYTVIDFTVNRIWDNSETAGGLKQLQVALRRSEDFRILWTNGVYDFVTTIGLARYGISKLRYTPGQIIVREYPSGHMSYVGVDSQKQLADDIRAFMNKEVMTTW